MDLDSSLMLELLLILHYLQSDILLMLMIKDLESLSKTALTYPSLHFISVSDVILLDHFVIATLVIKTEIVV